MHEPKNVLIIEDHEIVVWALQRVVAKVVEHATIYTASELKDGLEILSGQRADLIIFDIGVPGGNTPEAIGWFREIQPDVSVLIHSGLPEKDHSVTYLTAGANGFVSKNSPMADISVAIETVMRGKKYISPLTYEVMADSILNETVSIKKKRQPLRLTDREHEVIKLLLAGKWTKEIADELGLKITTISTHKAHIFEKFGVHNPIDLFLAVQERMPELIGHT